MKLAYDGRLFIGSQRQPGLRTVESETIDALVNIGAISSIAESRFRFSSRTDRGVSALGNVFSFVTSFDRKSLLRALNAASLDVMYYAVTEVPMSFSPRRARQRWYRYLFSSDNMDLEMVEQCATLFEGRHDFKGFCKPDGRSTVRTLNSFRISSRDEILVADIKGREFLRSQVRRMMAAVIEVGSGKISIDEVASVLDGKAKCFGVAPPEHLILMDVDHGLEFETIYSPTLNRKVTTYRMDVASRKEFIDTLCARLA